MRSSNFSVAALKAESVFAFGDLADNHGGPYEVVATRDLIISRAFH
jgi:hypothetical protein